MDTLAISPQMPTQLPGPYAIGETGDGIISLWQRRMALSQTMRQPYETQWVKNWKMYRAFIEDAVSPDDWWRSNVFIPEMFNAVETLLPRIMLGMFSRPEWFGVRCPHNDYPGHPGISCGDYERMCKSLLMSVCNQMKRPSLFEEAYGGHKYTKIMGHCWWRLTWDIEQGTRMVDMPQFDEYTGEVAGMSSMAVPMTEYDLPRLRFLSNFRVWPDPTGRMNWIVEDVDTTLEELEEDNNARGIYQNLDMLAMTVGTKPNKPMDRSDVSQGGPIAQSGEDQVNAVEGFSGTALDRSVDGTPVRVHYCWGKVNYEPEDGIPWRLQCIANENVVIRDEPAPTPDGRPPYFASKSIPIPGFVYGDSELRYAGPLNEQLNRIENFRMDEVVLGIWQQYIGNSNAVKDTRRVIEPGGITWVDTANDVQTAFRVLERRPVNPEAYRESEVKRDQMERVTGATAAQQGAGAMDRETATGFSGRIQLGNERFRLSTMYTNMTWKQEFLSRIFALCQRHMPPDKLVRIVGTDFQVPIDISMLQDNVDIDIETDVVDMDNPAKQQAFSFLLQTTLTSPEVLVRTKLDALLRDTYESFLNRDGRKYVKSDEELAAEAMAQVQAAMFAGAVGGGESSAQLGNGSGAGSGRGEDSGARRSLPPYSGGGS